MAANQEQMTPVSTSYVHSSSPGAYPSGCCNPQCETTPDTVTCKSLLPAFKTLGVGNSMKQVATKSRTYDKVYKTVRIVSKTIYGTLRIAMHRKSRKKYAVKQFHKNLIKKKRTLGGLAVQENFSVELKLMNWLRQHPHAGLIAASPENEQVEDLKYKYIVMPLASEGDLLSFIRKCNGKMSEDTVRDICLQLISALQHLHENGKYIHGDVSPENILLSYDEAGKLRIQLCDYGLARKIGSRHHYAGKKSYMPPELYSKELPNAEPASDIFSLGVVMFLLYYGIPPFTTAQKSDVYYEGLEHKHHFRASSYSPWLLAWGISKKRSKWALLPTVLSMLQRKQNKRPTLSSIKTMVEGWKQW